METNVRNRNLRKVCIEARKIFSFIEDAMPFLVSNVSCNFDTKEMFSTEEAEIMQHLVTKFSFDTVAVTLLKHYNSEKNYFLIQKVV